MAALPWRKRRHFMMVKKSPPKYARFSSADRRAMLIEAGLTCLARDGILGFTIDRICVEAKISRGLITHHFKSIDGLLAAVYETIYDKTLLVFEGANPAPQNPEQRIITIIETMFSREFFNRESLNIWLALWGEMANNPTLLKAHRKQYARYRADVEQALSDVAKARGISIDAALVATMFISLVDGLGLEWCIEPKLLSARVAKDACYKMLEPILGPLKSL